MTCEVEGCENLPMRSGKCATHARLERKAEEESLKPVKAKNPIDKVGKKNLSYCSDGSSVTQIEIVFLRNEAYDKADLAIEFLASVCQGCMGESQGHAHIIPQSRCKQLKKTELIWDERNFFPACHKCNAIAENVSSIAITKLLNYPRIKAFIELHDYARFTKLPDFKLTEEPHRI